MSLVALQREFRSLLTDQDATPVALGFTLPPPAWPSIATITAAS